MQRLGREKRRGKREKCECKGKIGKYENKKRTKTRKEVDRRKLEMKEREIKHKMR